MPLRSVLLTLFLLLPAIGLAIDPFAPPGVPAGEQVSTAAVVDAGVLYAASFEEPDRAGHLRAVAFAGSRPVCLWDAAELIPAPGAALPPPSPPDLAELTPSFGGEAGERRLFTNLAAEQGYRLLAFDARASTVLQSPLGAASVAEAAALINAVRGRLQTSAAAPAGSGDRTDRLGAISRSSPALVGGSPLAGAAFRDRVLYAGSEDGLLHAVLAGRWSGTGNGYDPAAPGCGRELWGYLPGNLLPGLAAGTADPDARPSPGHVDGSPVVSDLFIDGDGDGRREWRTVLVGTASRRGDRRGVVFALDVTDPHAPRLLWERVLEEAGLGRSRGAAIGAPAGRADAVPRVFVTAATAERIAADGSPDPAGGRLGVMACALDLVTGTLLWRFAVPYSGEAGVLTDAPTPPSLMSASGGGGIEGVVFGDLAGQLWCLDPATGAPLGGRPVWQAPGGSAEPVGGALAVHNRLVLFGTGGAETADPLGRYAVYAVEILADGGRLLWNHPLDPGERLWGAPTLDRFGRAFFGVGVPETEGGRLLVVAANGEMSGSVVLAGMPADGVAIAPGAVVVVTRSGQVDRIGELQPEAAVSPAEAARLSIFSWRLR